MDGNSGLSTRDDFTAVANGKYGNLFNFNFFFNYVLDCDGNSQGNMKIFVIVILTSTSDLSVCEYS